MYAIDWARMWRPERSPWETMIRAVIVYVFAHVAFRVVGRKELGRHAAYDIVLLLFVGVAMRQSIVGSDASLTSAMVGFATLVAVDAGVTWLTRASPSAARLIDGPVRDLVRDGHVNEEEMRRAHFSYEQLLAALRAHGRERIDDAHRAYLERSGRISVVFNDAPHPTREP
jgi:uncharacterized membrane protein YcaP (DUF421 family)